MAGASKCNAIRIDVQIEVFWALDTDIGPVELNAIRCLLGAESARTLGVAVEAGLAGERGRIRAVVLAEGNGQRAFEIAEVGDVAVETLGAGIGVYFVLLAELDHPAPLFAHENGLIPAERLLLEEEAGSADAARVLYRLGQDLAVFGDGVVFGALQSVAGHEVGFEAQVALVLGVKLEAVLNDLVLKPPIRNRIRRALLC